MTDTSGPPLRTPFAFYDQDTSCWRTSQATFLSDSDRYSETWPRSGTTRGGFAYERPMPALRMAEPVSSSSLPTPRATRGGSATETAYLLNGRHRSGALLPTPEAKLSDSGPDYARAERPDSGGDDLTTTLHRLFPTPRATDGTKGGPNQRGSSGDLMLPSAVQALLPTPSVSDGTGGHLTRGGARSDELLLPGVAKSLTLLPTPTSQAAKHSTDDRGHGTLDDFNLWSVAARVSNGELTAPPSPGGSTSPDAQLPDLLNPDPEAESA